MQGDVIFSFTCVHRKRTDEIEIHDESLRSFNIWSTGKDVEELVYSFVESTKLWFLERKEESHEKYVGLCSSKILIEDLITRYSTRVQAELTCFTPWLVVFTVVTINMKEGIDIWVLMKQTMTAYGGNLGTVARILILGKNWRWAMSSTLHMIYPL